MQVIPEFRKSNETEKKMEGKPQKNPERVENRLKTRLGTGTLGSRGKAREGEGSSPKNQPTNQTDRLVGVISERTATTQITTEDFKGNEKPRAGGTHSQTICQIKGLPSGSIRTTRPPQIRHNHRI